MSLLAYIMNHGCSLRQILCTVSGIVLRKYVIVLWSSDISS
jgi:hypothetical protein